MGLQRRIDADAECIECSEGSGDTPEGGSGSDRGCSAPAGTELEFPSFLAARRLAGYVEGEDRLGETCHDHVGCWIPTFRNRLHLVKHAIDPLADLLKRDRHRRSLESDRHATVGAKSDLLTRPPALWRAWIR